MKRSNSLYNYRELEDILAKEVNEKQDLISALSKEKHSLTKRLKLVLKEIKQDKTKIKDKVQKQATETMLGESLPEPSPKIEEEKILTKPSPLPSPGNFSRNLHISTSVSEEAIKGKSESQHVTPKASEGEERNEELQIGQVFDQHDQRVAVLEKDRKLYDMQYKKLAQKVNSLKTQLAESLQEATKCIYGLNV